MTADGFDYAQVADADVRELARDNAAAIKALLGKSGRTVVEIGRRLLQVKAAVDADAFDAWRESEVRITAACAFTYMRVGKRFGHVNCLEGVHASALYLLARENVPQDLVDQCLARARAGEVITYKEAKRLCAESHVALTSRGRKPETVTLRLRDAATLSRSLDKVETVLRQAYDRLTRDEREALAERFLRMALDLRREPAEAEKELVRA